MKTIKILDNETQYQNIENIQKACIICNKFKQGIKVNPCAKLSNQ
jgi:hypothetical protein